MQYKCEFLFIYILNSYFKIFKYIVRDREGVVNLINTLSNGEIGAIPINEDSNSLEISEKPIIDTGQITTSPSLEDEVVQENGIHMEGSDEKELDKSGGEDFEDEREQDDINEAGNAEEDVDGEDELTNDESSKQNTEEDDSQQTIQNEMVESNPVETPPLLSSCPLKILNAKVDTLSEKETVSSQEKELSTIQKTMVTTIVSNDTKPVETYKSEEHTIVSNSKIDSEESVPLKSIETPVITSPLKLVNVSEMKQLHEEKVITGITHTLNITKKYEDSADQVMKSLDKLSNKNSFLFTSTDMPTTHNKLSVKPIDQLAANLVRMQSEKLEKPSGAKSLEKIAENLARSGSIVGNIINGDDDRIPQDFCARKIDKVNSLREHRGMDLSTSPRGWENTNEQNRPMDFSGIDLSSRKFNKTIDLPSAGYRAQDFQHREMDLSTKKINKPEVTNLPYDARAVMMRNHSMVADLSKRQMSFPGYDMPPASYHNASRISNKEDHRLPNYTILPDPSKITALRMNPTPIKRPLEGDDMQQDILKRIRADVIPIRSSMDKRSIMSSNWRDEVGETIEEPMIMIQGEGSGSDCDAVNPALGEAVEEPIIFFYGEGSGEECQTGNPGEDTSTDNKESNESKNEADSATSSLLPSKNLGEDSLIHEVSTGSLITSKNTIKLNRNYPQSSINVRSNRQTVGSTQEKSKFKPSLGIQIIPKNSNSSVKRISRWDVGKPEEKPECDSSIISNEEDISQKRNEIECENSSNKNQNVKMDGNSVSNENSTSQKRNVEAENSQDTEGNSLRQKLSPVSQDSMQCDSSISLCQADTSETLEFYPEITPTTQSISNKDAAENVCDSDSITSHETNTAEKVDNECKPAAASPPRFFFGPNCISYTSRAEVFESSSDHTVSTTIESKSDTLQYECVSSSKPVEDITSYTSDDFGVTQMNNNSLKINSYAPTSNSPLHEDDNKNKIEKVGESTNIWEETVPLKYSIDGGRCAMQKTEIDLSSSESKEENFKSIVQDSITSSENTKNEYTKSEETEISGIISQPHSTNDTNMQDANIKLENAIVTPSTVQLDSNIESMQPEISTAESNTLEEQVRSQNKISDLQNDTDETVKTPILCSKDEADCKSSDISTLKKSELETDTTSVNNSCSSFAQNSELGCTSKEEFSTYQEVDSLAEKEMEHVSEKEFDLSVESSKQNDKNDNIPEFHNQEKQLINPDNENMKILTDSDVHLAHNCIKNSKKIEISEQNEISVNSFIKNSVPDVNTKLDLTDNFTVTSSELIEQCKDSLVPTISSSDGNCTHKTSIHESAKVHSDSEKFSFKDECSIYNVLAETVPDTNNFKPSKSDAIEAEGEMIVSNIIDIETLENRSSCVDQDSNKDMSIDDKLSKSDNEPFKLNEEKECFDDNLSYGDTRSISLELCSSSDETNKFGTVVERKKTEDVNDVDIQQKSDTMIEPIISEDKKMIEQDEKININQCDYIIKHIEDSNVKNEELNSTNNTVENANNTQQEYIIEKSKAEEPKLNQIDINPVNLQEPDKIKQPLVANYESSDSNDDSNDAFESPQRETIENKNNLFTDLEEETMISNEQKIKQTIQKLITKDEELSEELQNAVTNKKGRELVSENSFKKMENEEAEYKEVKITNNEIIEEEYNCIVSQFHLNEKLIINEKKDINISESNSAEVIKEEVSSIVSETEPVNKENINSALTKTNNVIGEISENDGLVQVSDKITNTISEGRNDSETINSINIIKTQKQTNEDIEFNDVEKEISCEGLKEQCVKPMEEKLITSFDNDIKFIKNKEVEHVTEEFSIIESYNKLTEFSGFSNKDNKFAAHLHDEGDFNKDMSENDITIHSVQNILPLDKFDNTSSGIDKSEIYENNISTIPEDFKSTDNLQFVNFISEKSENLSATDNHEKHSESFHVINKSTESLLENTVSSLNDKSAVFNIQETTSESATVINDAKKATSKRLSDVSNIQDVPPLKSKSPYIESSEQILEDLTNSKVQLGQNLDNFKQVEIDENKISGEVVSNSTTKHLAKHEYSTISNTADIVLNKVVQEHNDENDEKKGSSEIQSIEVKTVSVSSDDSMEVDNENLFSTVPEEMDPLACTDDDTFKKLDDNEQSDISAPKIGLRVKPVSELVYDGWKLDSTELPRVSRKRCNSSHESNSEDIIAKQNDEEIIGGKRIKLRAERIPDKQLRKSVEENRVVTISSEDEVVKCSPEKSEDQEVKDVSDDQSTTHSVAIGRKTRGRPRGRRRRYRGSGRSARPKHSEFQSIQTSEVSSEIHLDETPSNNDSLNMTPISQKKRKKSKFLFLLSYVYIFRR